jgi:hypothetical protein
MALALTSRTGAGKLLMAASLARHHGEGIDINDWLTGGVLLSTGKGRARARFFIRNDGKVFRCFRGGHRLTTLAKAAKRLGLK